MASPRFSRSPDRGRLDLAIRLRRPGRLLALHRFPDLRCPAGAIRAGSSARAAPGKPAQPLVAFRHLARPAPNGSFGESSRGPARDLESRFLIEPLFRCRRGLAGPVAAATWTRFRRGRTESKRWPTLTLRALIASPAVIGRRPCGASLRPGGNASSDAGTGGPDTRARTRRRPCRREASRLTVRAKPRSRRRRRCCPACPYRPSPVPSITSPHRCASALLLALTSASAPESPSIGEASDRLAPLLASFVVVPEAFDEGRCG